MYNYPDREFATPYKNRKKKKIKIRIQRIFTRVPHRGLEEKSRAQSILYVGKRVWKEKPYSMFSRLHLISKGISGKNEFPKVRLRGERFFFFLQIRPNVYAYIYVCRKKKITSQSLRNSIEWPGKKKHFRIFYPRSRAGTRGSFDTSRRSRALLLRFLFIGFRGGAQRCTARRQRPRNTVK